MMWTTFFERKYYNYWREFDDNLIYYVNDEPAY